MGNGTAGSGETELQESNFRVRYIFYFAGLLLIFLAVLSYSPADGASITGGIDAPPKNWIGNLGAFLAYWLFNLFGLTTYVLLFLTLLRAVRAFLPGAGRPLLFFTGELMLLFGLMLLFALSPYPFVYVTDHLGIGRAGVPELALSGGAIGQVLAAPPVEEFALQEGVLRKLIGAVGTMIFGWTLVTGGLIVIYFSDWHALFRNHIFNFPAVQSHTPASANREPEELPATPASAAAAIPAAPAVQTPPAPAPAPAPAPSTVPGGLFGSARAALAALRERHQTGGASVGTPEVMPQPVAAETPPPPATPEPPAPATPALQNAPAAPAAPAAAAPMRNVEVNAKVIEQGEKLTAKSTPKYTLPPITMLSKGTDAVGEAPEAIERATLLLQRTLDSFKIPGQVVGHISGPRITRYEISLAEGVNVKKVEQISSNIAMNLSAPSIRVLAPIPGRNVVGVEVPNTRSEAVYMRAVMETDAWNGKAAIPIVLGKDVASKPVVLDLAKAPHLLIAGSTGSGKSVCMNTLIMSLLFKFNPDDLRLIMVDPKIVEFEDYKKLPHLITPVINDAKKVPIALRWAVTEMENRYKILARAGVKKLAEFNALSHNGEPILDSDGNVICDNSGEPLCKMPILIVIIDELAELRMQDSWKDSETYIARIAQLGRASGVHIVVATQRPSTNIITGVIKANLPTRIAFRVMQLVDSRVILDVPGAENLLGMGDMLYLAPGGMNIERVQGALVDDKDIKAIVKFVSEQRPQNFNAQVVAEEEAQDEEIDENMVDDYDEEDAADIAPLIRKYLRPGDDDNVRRALEVVLLDRKASTSYLQRRLKIGYNRAAEIIDLFEERGIVGPPSGSGNKREILVFDEAEFAG